MLIIAWESKISNKFESNCCLMVTVSSKEAGGGALGRSQVVVDSTADMDPQEAAELGIEVVPHTVYWDGIAFLDRVELSVDEFYRKLREEKGTPGHPNLR